MGCHFLLQGIFQTQGSHPGLLYCRQILYWLSYQESSEHKGTCIFSLVFLFSLKKKKKPWSRISGLYDICITFWESSTPFSTVAAPIYIPTYSAWRFSFLQVLASTCFSCLFDDNHSDRCEVISHSGSDLHFPHDYWCWASFLYVCWSSLYLFKMSSEVLCPFFEFFLKLSFMSSLCSLDINPS